MLPTWMIEKLERDRRARDEQARPYLEVELPCPEEHEAPSDDEREPEHGAQGLQRSSEAKTAGAVGRVRGRCRLAECTFSCSSPCTSCSVRGFRSRDRCRAKRQEDRPVCRRLRPRAVGVAA
jgi:hypothetical protein